MSSSEETDAGKNIWSKKSRKTPRTPRKTVKKEESNKMMDILKQLAVDVKDIKREQSVYAEELKALRSDNERLRKENESIKKEEVRELYGWIYYLNLYTIERFIVYEEESKTSKKASSEETDAGKKIWSKKSRKTPRTPRKTVKKEESNKMIDISKHLAVDVKDIKREQSMYAEELKALRSDTERLRKLSVDVKDIKKEQSVYTEELKALRSDNERLRKENESIKKEEVRELYGWIYYLNLYTIERFIVYEEESKPSKKASSEETDAGKKIWSKRSRKTPRTPRKTVKKEESNKMMDILKHLAVDVKDIKREQSMYAEELKALRSDTERLRKQDLLSEKGVEER
ncbi:hypothetical protein FQA39_LY00919 [Lamprigera yunnana]|nr:hypothetical protein FQA39_LY00919 [Lamprigera yunnana]